MITSRSTRDQHVDQRDKCCIMLRVLQIQAESVLTTYYALILNWVKLSFAKKSPADISNNMNNKMNSNVNNKSIRSICLIFSKLPTKTSEWCDKRSSSVFLLNSNTFSKLKYFFLIYFKHQPTCNDAIRVAPIKNETKLWYPAVLVHGCFCWGIKFNSRQ